MVGCNAQTALDTAPLNSDSTYEQDREIYEQQVKETDRQLKISGEQADRFDKLLERWEQQADRQDRILDKQESQLQ